MTAQWLTQKPIAHRGLHSGREVPENSLAAIRNCIWQNIPAEVDLIQLSDGNIAVFHDQNLKRLCGISAPIRSCTKEDLKPVRLYQTTEPIPMLEDLLELVRGKVPLLLELKHLPGPQDPKEAKSFALALRNALSDYQGSVALQSFNALFMPNLRRFNPGIPRGLILEEFPPREPPGVDFLTLRWDVIRQRSMKALPVLAWTVRHPGQWLTCQKVCDNIIYENFSPLDQ